MSESEDRKTAKKIIRPPDREELATEKLIYRVILSAIATYAVLLGVFAILFFFLMSTFFSSDIIGSFATIILSTGSSYIGIKFYRFAKELAIDFLESARSEEVINSEEGWNITLSFITFTLVGMLLWTIPQIILMDSNITPSLFEALLAQSIKPLDKIVAILIELLNTAGIVIIVSGLFGFFFRLKLMTVPELYCSNCSENIDSDDEFCGSCGAVLIMSDGNS